MTPDRDIQAEFRGREMPTTLGHDGAANDGSAACADAGDFNDTGLPFGHDTRKELDCGIRRERILSWLNDELTLPRDETAWVFSSPNGSETCRITATPLPDRVIASMSFEHTLLTITGDDQAAELFFQLLTLRFMSAGG